MVKQAAINDFDPVLAFLFIVFHNNSKVDKIKLRRRQKLRDGACGL